MQDWTALVIALSTLMPSLIAWLAYREGRWAKREAERAAREAVQAAHDIALARRYVADVQDLVNGQTSELLAEIVRLKTEMIGLQHQLRDR